MKHLLYLTSVIMSLSPPLWGAAVQNPLCSQLLFLNFTVGLLNFSNFQLQSFVAWFFGLLRSQKHCVPTDEPISYTLLNVKSSLILVWALSWCVGAHLTGVSQHF